MEGIMTSNDNADTMSPKPLSRARRQKRPKCKLDERNCLNLQDVLAAYGGPIGQEQTWALCHQTAQAFFKLNPSQYFELKDVSDIKLHQDGHVVLDVDKVNQNQAVTEQEVVAGLGYVIFRTLDYNLSEEEEIAVSPELESLVIAMTKVNDETEEEPLHETDDEGIETDSGVGEYEESSSMPRSCTPSYDRNGQPFLLTHIVKACEQRLDNNGDHKTGEYYRKVISNVVREAIDLANFLHATANDRKKSSLDDSCLNLSENSKHQSMNMLVDPKDFNNWARFWVQVIGDLRKGVTLKKVEENLTQKRSNDEEKKSNLTPYESLMDDIRQRRYHLKKAPEPSANRRKDTHAVILDYIRSRPSLKKASDRKLAPLKKEYTLRELLMENIRQAPKLKPVPRRRHIFISPLKPIPSDVHSESRADERGTKTAWRSSDIQSSTSSVGRCKKLIPVDFDLKLDADDDDDDDDLDDDFEISKLSDEDDEHVQPSAIEDDDEKDSANPWRKTGALRLTKNEYHRFCDAQLEFYDLATQCPTRRASMRRHTGRTLANPIAGAETSALPPTRPLSRQHTIAQSANIGASVSLNSSPSRSPQTRSRPLPRPRGLPGDKDDSTSSDDKIVNKNLLADMFLDERMSLTLEEIVHIRSVLTKAELESLPVEGRVKEDVEKRRVCFLCLKTRFGILGPWGQRCKLCERTVCVKCYAKMRIPTEHFSHVPVVLLSPGIMSPSSSDADSGTKSPWSKTSMGVAGSAPASPASRRKDSAARGATPSSTPQTTPGTVPTPPEKRFYGSPSKLSSTSTFGVSPEQRLAAEKMRGVSMVVCHDCRIMVLQIIKSSRTTRATIRNNVISRLTLNLTPTYV